MKVVDPADTTHAVTLIPRFYPDTAITLELKNETTDEVTTVANTYAISNGFFTITFDYTFVNKDRYQVKLLEGTDVAYRGKIIATDQEPQDYKQTDGLYIYE